MQSVCCVLVLSEAEEAAVVIATLDIISDDFVNAGSEISSHTGLHSHHPVIHERCTKGELGKTQCAIHRGKACCDATRPVILSFDDGKASPTKSSLIISTMVVFNLNKMLSAKGLRLNHLNTLFTWESEIDRASLHPVPEFDVKISGSTLLQCILEEFLL